MDIENKNEKSLNRLGPIFAVLIMRLWLGVRSLQSGIEKFSTQVPVSTWTKIDGHPNEHGVETITYIKKYGFDHYSGMPASTLQEFKEEPFFSESILTLYSACIGPAFIILGISLLLGVLSRVSLLGMGLIYTSLTFGLILLNQSSGVAWLASHILLVVLMLLYIEFNRLEISRIIPGASRFAVLRNL